MEYVLLESREPNEVFFTVTIRGQKKVVRFYEPEFAKFYKPNKSKFYVSDSFVFVKIADCWDNVSNKLRSTTLELQKKNGKYRIINSYTVLKKIARIECWEDDPSVPQSAVARDSICPHSNEWDGRYERLIRRIQKHFDKILAEERESQA